MDGNVVWVTLIDGEEVFRSQERLHAIDRALSRLGTEEVFTTLRFKVLGDAVWSNGVMRIEVVKRKEP